MKKGSKNKNGRVDSRKCVSVHINKNNRSYLSGSIRNSDI